MPGVPSPVLLSDLCEQASFFMSSLILLPFLTIFTVSPYAIFEHPYQLYPSPEISYKT
ncbi:hypothetical protein G881_02011 [Escherichia coli KOEGE 30 (63a)]|nr:hypothetical protein G881_02011 [Escherichia coli KOEGE 30 (63a)]